MASGTNYSQEYGQAEKAYLESDFAQAAEIIDHLAEEYPTDPNVLLLRGHIYCYGFQNYDLARQQYEKVLELSEDVITELQRIIGEFYTVEGDLRRQRLNHIKELIEIKCYRGTRHRKRLPCRGQKTKNNAKTCKKGRRG